MFSKRLGIVATLLFSVGACKTVSKSPESSSASQDESPVKTVQVAGTRSVEPPRVALFRPVVSADLKKTVNADKLFEMWDAEFELIRESMEMKMPTIKALGLVWDSKKDEFSFREGLTIGIGKANKITKRLLRLAASFFCFFSPCKSSRRNRRSTRIIFRWILQ